MTRRLFKLMFATAFTLTLAFAQRGFNPGGQAGSPPSAEEIAARRVESLTRLLTLTDAQQTQAKAIFTSAATAQEPLQTRMATARQSLAEAVKKNDIGAINSLAATIGDLTAQLTAIEAKAEAAFYQILTADQQAKYGEFPRGGGGRGAGPAGMRGPRW